MAVAAAAVALASVQARARSAQAGETRPAVGLQLPHGSGDLWGVLGLGSVLGCPRFFPGDRRL